MKNYRSDCLTVCLSTCLTVCLSTCLSVCLSTCLFLHDSYIIIEIHITLFLQEMIDEADKDGDGEVSEAEFLRIMKKTNMY